MYFGVNFRTNDTDKALVERLGSPGLDILDTVREDYPELKGLKAESIYIAMDCPINGSETFLEISEDFARKSGHYAARLTHIVTVSEHALSKYIRHEIKREYVNHVIKSAVHFFGVRIQDAIVEEVLNGAIIRTYFDHKALLEDWEAAGFPTDWL